MNTILTGELITVDGEERRYPRNHEPLMRWAKASGFDPDVTVSDSMTVDGDTITAEQFVFDAQGELIPTKDGGGVETTTITRQQAYPIPAPARSNDGSLNRLPTSLCRGTYFLGR